MRRAVALGLAGAACIAALSWQSARAPAPDPVEALAPGRVVRFVNASLEYGQELVVRERRGQWIGCAPTEDAIYQEAGALATPPELSDAPGFSHCRTYADWIVALDAARKKAEDEIARASQWAAKGWPKEPSLEVIATQTAVRDNADATYRKMMALLDEAAAALAAQYESRPVWINAAGVTGFRVFDP